MRLRKELVVCAVFLVVCAVLQFNFRSSVFPVLSAQPTMAENTDGFITLQEQEIYHKLYRPTVGELGVTVILLHGAAFSSQTWEDIGTLKHLAEQGILAFAIDLPGFGKSTDASVTNKTEFAKSVVDYIDGDIKVVVSPSMSGSFSIPYINTYGDEIDGYVPVAPVSVLSLDPPEKVRNKLQVFAVVGENDLPAVNSLSIFEQIFENYKQLIIENGAHPAYLTDPDLFNSELSNFTLSLK